MRCGAFPLLPSLVTVTNTHAVCLASQPRLLALAGPTLDGAARRGRAGAARWLRRSLTLVLCALLGACAEPNDDAQREVAAELRALRLALREPAPTAATGSAPASGPADRAALTAALQPLHELVSQLQRQQQQLGGQQSHLVGELQRWTTVVGPLLAAGHNQAAEAARTELAGMAQRLQQLEQTLAAQDARHREVEALLGQALDRTTDRLEQFLQRVAPRRETAPEAEGAPAGGAIAPGPTPQAEAVPGSSVPGNSVPGNSVPGNSVPGNSVPGNSVPGSSRIGAASPRAWLRSARPAEVAAWLGSLVVALAVGVGFAFRRRRAGGAELAPAVPDPAVADLLAVAPMLGPEPVCPMLDAPPEPVVVPAAATGDPTVEAVRPAAPDDDLPDDGLFVLEDAELVSGETEPLAESLALPQSALPAPPEPTAPQEPAPQPPGPAPELPAVVAATPRTAPRVWVVPSQDPAAAAARLQGFWAGEPRLCREPAPEVSIGPGLLLVTCWPRPGLAAAALAALEVAVRTAARA
jgi:hypothetical protein